MTIRYMKGFDAIDPAALAAAAKKITEPALPVNTAIAGGPSGVIVLDHGKYYRDGVELDPEEGARLFEEAVGKNAGYAVFEPIPHSRREET